jgi:mannose-6-phosphate isomerase-like protein (cupin superfamily)
MADARILERFGEKGFDRQSTDPWNRVFQVVFFPDRIYHAQYLNATRSSRYRYNVREVRGKADINVLKGNVYMDGLEFSNFVRIEYRGSRLAEQARERSRFLGSDVMAFIDMITDEGKKAQAMPVAMHYCPWIDAFQVELWQTLEPPLNKRHDYQVLDLMGHRGSITRLSQFDEVLKDCSKIKRVNLAFRENDITEHSRFHLNDEQTTWDNFFGRNIQVPNSANPNSSDNTVPEQHYGVDFQRGWYVKNVAKDVPPVKYKNAMMDADNVDRREGPGENIVEMRWVFQQELGGSMVFFHEVTVPPSTVEGTHRHIGSEELYYITEGEGIAYMGASDDPILANSSQYPTVTRQIYGFGSRECKEVPVEPGSVIFTKSGGMHGIRNPSPEKPLKFVAFLYHSA